MYETDSMSLVRFRDRLILYSLLLQTLVFQAEILVAHVPLGSWLFGEDVCNWPSKRQVKNQLLHRSCFGCQAVIFSHVHSLPNSYRWGIGHPFSGAFTAPEKRSGTSGDAENSRGSSFKHRLQKARRNTHIPKAKAGV
jgi:hypothetical protein